MSTLKITLLQHPLVWRDGEANLRHFDTLLAPLSGRDLIVLPEMFTTGFAMDAGESALPEQQVIDWLHGWASKSNALVGGSVALKTAEGAVNRFLLVEPNGRVHAYDKRHLFRMAGEQCIIRRANGVKFSNGAAGGFCRRFVMTYASQSGLAINKITIWRCTSPTGRHRAANTGKPCWQHAPLKTRCTWLAAIVWAKTAMG